MKATTPPRRCASARTCWQIVVLPDDSGPKISVIRPRGMPPTPSARSSAIDPVGIESTPCRSAEPSFMIAPRPNCFSIARRAASTALPRSAVARSAVRSSVIATRSSRSYRLLRPGGRTGPRWIRRRSGLVFGLFHHGLGVPRLSDQLHVLGRLRERRQGGLGALGLGLLLLLFARSVSRTHRVASTSMTRLSAGASRGLLGHCTAAHPARARPQSRHVSGEGTGPDRSTDPCQEV